VCGVFGVISKSNFYEDSVRDALKNMGYRGPDASRIETITSHNLGKLTIGHVRLSIIDLDPRSNQPFKVSNDLLAFNGEIYNYKELRADLSLQSCQFDTTGDTEVLAKLLNKKGVDALSDCKGMWAGFYYSKEKDSAYIFTDPFGEKPLFTYACSEYFVFSSDLSAITKFVKRSLYLDKQKSIDAIINGYKGIYKDTQTFVKHVSRLGAGSVMDLQTEKITKIFKVTPDDFRPDHDITNGDDWIPRVRMALYQCVALRTRSDVPLAFCLSGGIDSNALLAIAADLGVTDSSKAYTILNADSRYDEAEMVSLAVKKYGVEHEYIQPESSSFVDTLTEMVLARCAPVATISYYTQFFLLKKLANDGFKVSISGTGADEIFSGYYDHHLLYFSSEMDDIELGRAETAFNTHIRDVIRNPLLKNSQLYRSNPSFREHIYFRAKEYNYLLREGFASPFSEAAFSTDLMRNRMCNEMFHEAVPVIVHEDDFNAMQNSVENRSPFLDWDLFKLMAKVPSRYLIQGGYAKYLLRSALDELVPKEILWSRRKVGFNSSLSELIKDDYERFRSCIFDSTRLFEILDKTSLEKKFESDYQAGALLNSDSKFWFNVANIAILANEFGWSQK
jgi:asparagine synthase (glutamine-hydrolysing)